MRQQHDKEHSLHGQQDRHRGRPQAESGNPHQRDLHPSAQWHWPENKPRARYRHAQQEEPGQAAAQGRLRPGTRTLIQLDIYRRPEPEHEQSFMAVPTGRSIPQEVANVDWLLLATAIEVDVEAASLADYAIDRAGDQIGEKGYAITSISHQVAADS
ncbi:MAG: hypothetical protein NVS2B4_04810 [Ramlibacter sp.]